MIFWTFFQKEIVIEIKIKKCALSFLSIPHIDIVHPDQKKTVLKWIKSDLKKKEFCNSNFFVYLKLTYKLSLSKEIILLWFWYWYPDFFYLRLSNHFWIKIMSTYASKYELISWASRILLRVFKNILGWNIQKFYLLQNNRSGLRIATKT